MESNYVKELAEIMKKNGVTKLDIEEGHSKISIERGAAGEFSSSAVQYVRSQDSNDISGEDILPEIEEKYIEIKSPMVGVFYSAKGPGEKDFVSVGDSVISGDVMCIIEAMKLMNDITAEQSGVVEEVCVNNGDIVEFGQVLFKLR